jgi:hypothetical protein
MATPGAVNPAAASLGVTSFLNIVGNTAADHAEKKAAIRRWSTRRRLNLE